MAKKGIVIFKWATLALLLAYCVVMGAWGRSEADRHTCAGIDINVRGNRQMDSVVIHGVSRELARYPEKIIGRRISEINPAKIETYLSGLNNFESVSCMMSSGEILHIEIVPLVPVMRVFDGNESYYINKDGKRIKSNAQFYTDVPVVKGSFSDSFRPESLLPVVRFVGKDKFLSEMTTMISADNATNIMLVPRMMGHLVNFGDTTRLQEKKEALRLFYRKVMPYKGWEEYDTISVKFKGQVIATRRLKPIVEIKADTVPDIDPDETTLADHLATATEV